MWFVYCFLAFTASTSLLANGTIVGKVTDATNGEVLRSATVRLEGTKLGAMTDTKGEYRIKNVPEGKYKIMARYVGYQDFTSTDSIVVGAKPVSYDIKLDLKESKKITVTAKANVGNANTMIEQRKNASQVSDGITKEDIRKLPDSDAGQALARVTGVTINKGSVIVRGANERYSNTTLNGTALTSTEPDKKSFSFDMFPSELLENVNVVKSFTPDLPGNFTGGLVQLNTIDFPINTSLKVSMSQGYNDFVTFKDNAFLGSGSGSGDWLASGSSDRTMPSGIPADRLEMNKLLADVRAQKPEAIDRLNMLGRTFNNSMWKSGTETVSPAGSLNLTYTDIMSMGEEDELGLVASAGYNNSYQNNSMYRAGVLSNPNENLYTYNGLSSNRSTGWFGLLNLAYKLGVNNTLSFKNTYNRSADVDNVYLDGENFATGQVQKLFSFQYVEKSLYSGTVSGEHTLEFANNMLFDWKLGYSNSQRDEPDFRRLQFARNSSDSGQPYYAAIESTPQGSGARAGRFFSNLDDNAISGSVNGKIPVTTSINMKVGGLVENRSRSFSARSLTIVQGTDNDIFNSLSIPTGSSIPDLSPMFADSNYNVSTGRLSMSEDSKLSDHYDAQENLTAAYAMVDVPFKIADIDARVITGGRIEHSIQRLNSFSVTNDPVHVNQDLLDVLPSLNFILKPSETFNIRMSATQTLARPSLREFAPFQFYDFQQQATISGNPTLKRSLVQNYDLRLEYFPGLGEVISVSGFFKRYHDAIEETLFPQQSEIVRSFANANGVADNLGVEFEFRKSFAFVGAGFENFVASLNAALIQSTIEVNQAGVKDTRSMWGQSPYSINGSLYYTNRESGTTVTIGYNTFGKRIVQVNLVGVFQGNPHVYELPRDIIDLSVAQTIAEVFEIKVSVRDLLNQPLRWEQAGALIQSNRRGMGVSVGFGYKLQ